MLRSNQFPFMVVLSMSLHPRLMGKPKFGNWHIHIWSQFCFLKLETSTVVFKGRKNIVYAEPK
jgi:hypothetical protein